MNPHIIEDMEHMPHWLGWLPFVMMVIGAVTSYLFYIQRPYIPSNCRRAADALPFLLNKWYFDELYDLIFVRRRNGSAHAVEVGDGYIIDGFGPDGVSARVLDVTRNVVKNTDRILYHYAFG